MPQEWTLLRTDGMGTKMPSNDKLTGVPPTAAKEGD